MSVVGKKILMLFQTPWPLLGIWALGGVLSVVIPVAQWKGASKNYYNYYGKAVEYENNQRQYEWAQKQYEEAQNGNNNNNNNYVAKDCKWYQAKCRKQNYYYWLSQEGGDGDRYVQPLPEWYLTAGGKMGEEMDREREEQGLATDEASGAIKFVYSLSIMTFVGLLAYGAFAIYKKIAGPILFVSMGFFGLASFAQMILITQGVIATDDRELENSVYGWYGQLPVLMVYTNYAFVIFTLVFAVIFGIKAFVEQKFTSAEAPPRRSDSAAISAKQLKDEEPEDEPAYKSMA
mmetsp:Transcript_34339/g.71505  ORF Transcript_34339/g.71505 Transcript_34339/m.71505 type:complete len:290 (-) Transcript_34339:645-1514(-)|eukprot:CAMPEP_0172453492 /NCGR_PEP_ID=MMETSP1065-20121228/10786_1 /TAXON_ID=265537 /ORGANISM="Amphiprora paludosa, Strain CCMP125" /LENGTH=289 /DNA_ID=CAMNT_0013205675 /DNA_START=37 /DNA_END=906 /DNA_ORIENTATION=-